MSGDKLTKEQRTENLQRMREYLATLAPSLRLNEQDSYAFRHFAEHGHAFKKGCCVPRLDASANPRGLD